MERELYIEFIIDKISHTNTLFKKSFKHYIGSQHCKARIAIGVTLLEGLIEFILEKTFLCNFKIILN